MDAKLIAKIAVARTDGLTRTGTGYPINNGLLLTARHVVDFKERDNTKPIKIEWSESDANLQIELEPEAIKFAFDGGDEYDVVILCCQMPTELKIPPVFTLLETGKISSREAWESAGYPKINDFKKRDVTGVFGVDLATSKITLTLDNPINRGMLQEKDIDRNDAEKIKNGWGGMSGAPVFSITGRKIQAIMTNDDQWMWNQLIGVSIPWLLNNNADFRKAVGFDVNADVYEKYLIQQKRQIQEQLSNMKDNKLFEELVLKLALQPKPIKPEAVGEKLFTAFGENCLALFDTLLQASADTLKQDASQQALENVHTLFCMFASLMAPKSPAVKQAIIKLSVYSKMATEVSLAPLYDTNPNFEVVDGEVKGKYAMDASVFTRETGWQVDDFKDEAVKIASLGVQKKDIKSPRNSFELKKLNTTIKQRQNRSLNQLHRFELNFGEDKESSNPFHNQVFCQALNMSNCLPDLPIVHYGEAEAELEAELSAKIEELFKLLKEFGYPT
jgi:hypothetical protein